MKNYRLPRARIPSTKKARTSMKGHFVRPLKNSRSCKLKGLTRMIKLIVWPGRRCCLGKWRRDFRILIFLITISLSLPGTNPSSFSHTSHLPVPFTYIGLADYIWGKSVVDCWRRGDRPPLHLWGVNGWRVSCPLLSRLLLKMLKKMMMMVSFFEICGLRSYSTPLFSF